MLWRGHQAVQSSAQRWMMRGRHQASVGNYHHQFSSARRLGGVASNAAIDILLLQKPSILSNSDDLPSLVRYGDVRTNNSSNSLLISSHAFSTRGGRNKPRGPNFRGLQSVDEIIVTAYEHLDDMSRIDVCVFWTCISKLMTKRQPMQRSKSSNNNNIVELSYEDMEYMLFTIFDDTANRIEDYKARDLTEITLGMAKIIKILRQQGKRRGEDSSRVILRRLLLSEDLNPNRELFKLFAGASIDILDQFDARHLSNLAYTYALLDYVPEFDDGSDLFDQIAMKAVDIKAEFNAQDISNMTWAYATVGKPHAVLFEAMGDQVVAFEHLEEFRPQALANIVWAYATAGVRHPKLFEKVANHIVDSKSLDQFQPQNLSNIAWAYSTAGVHHPKLFEKVANHIVESNRLNRFQPQHLSNITWAYATAGISNPKLFEKVANHIVESGRLDRFTLQALSNIVWAYATAQVHHPKLFKKVAEAVIQRKGEFNSQQIANLLWAYATVGIVDKHLYSSFMPTAAKLVGTYNNQELINVAWAYTVADIDAPALFNDIFINACDEKKDGFVIEDLFQLHQWHLWQTKEKSHPGLQTDLQNRCYNAFISREPTVSKLQEDVVVQLSSIGLEPKEEVLMDSGYRIDAIVAVNGKTVGIEVDGPSHFIGKCKLLGKSKLPLASTILKRRQVPSIDGIELVSVPYWEWDKLGKDQAKKQDYLRKLLSLTTE